MGKKRKNDDLPEPPKPYPGSERFGDWDLGNIIPLEPGEVLPLDPNDPHKWARHGEPSPPVLIGGLRSSARRSQSRYGQRRADLHKYIHRILQLIASRPDGATICEAPRKLNPILQRSQACFVACARRAQRVMLLKWRKHRRGIEVRRLERLKAF